MKKWIFSFLLCLCINLGKAQTERILCGGVERWSVKVLTDGSVNTINFIPTLTTLDSLINIPTPIPGFSEPRIPGIEDQVYTIRCHITIKKFENDYDYHLVLSDGVNTLIGEAPDPVCSAASSSAFVNDFIAVRHFVDSNIAWGNVNNVNLPEVIVTGVAFIDLEHGQTGVAPNNLELHPILDIQFAPVGINEVRQGLLSVNIDPNPFHENILVNIFSKLNNLQNCSLQLFNSNATLVAEYNLPIIGRNKISETIKTNVEPGTYIYRIINDGKLIYDGKLIKN